MRHLTICCVIIIQVPIFSVTWLFEALRGWLKFRWIEWKKLVISNWTYNSEPRVNLNFKIGSQNEIRWKSGSNWSCHRSLWGKGVKHVLWNQNANHAVPQAKTLLQFLADILQCESDMMHTTGKYLVEINDQISKRQGIDDLVSILQVNESIWSSLIMFYYCKSSIAFQKIYKSILAWKERIDDLEARKAGMSLDLDVDQSKLGQVHSFKAICSLQTSKVKFWSIFNNELYLYVH